jgi:hypothetical protein
MLNPSYGPLLVNRVIASEFDDGDVIPARDAATLLRWSCRGAEVVVYHRRLF